MIQSLSTTAAAGIIALGSIATAVWFYFRKRKDDLPPTQWRQVAKLIKIHLYPLKSGHRIELQSADCTKFGLVQSAKDGKLLRLHDRSFLIVDDNGEFKTARTFPKIILIEVGAHDDEHVSFDAPGMRQLYVKIPSSDQPHSTIRLHQNEEIFALDCGDEAASWFSRYIYGKDSGLRLSFHDGSEANKRDLSKVYKNYLEFYKGLNESSGLYSDLSALLLVNQASVDDLNSKIDSQTVIAAEHFRPNLIVEGDAAPPFIEDYWKWIKIGDAIFRNVKPCTRCVLSTINPDTGVRNTNREPLKTLEKYRKLKDVIENGCKSESELSVMGANLGVYQSAEIHVNDIVYVGM